ncbi:WD40 repeat-like protein [Epithele typhae]|uniref:WD40 repeat-like protein n=1 Tax=Epithele typhae TaxID=378194 RepID=UPI002008B470|nr:WD40 repeat-like protein [Epithele typhae]KAH9945854.1 WD40 repeat-like protein [Epithele typhae]
MYGIAWSAETNSVFLASAASGIQVYNIASGALQVVYLRPMAKLLPHSCKITQTFESHKSTVSSLSLSNDASLLASTSANAFTSTISPFRIPSGGGDVSTCAFHPHSRTRLLVGSGAQILVYDTTRPSGPAKIIPLDKEQKNPGPIVAITCSPFSKTLVAAACSGGMVALVDLDKEKSLFKVVNMPAPITCLSFSAEGAALYAGTENGKLLILDLRALDKPPKSIPVSENGDQIIAISIQRKLKPGEAQVTKPSAAAIASKPLVQRDTNKAAPAARRTGSSTTASSDASKKSVEDKATSRTKLSALTTTTPRRPLGRTTSGSSQNVSPASRFAAGTKRMNPATAKSPTAARSTPSKRAFSPPKSLVTHSDKQDGDDEGDLSVGVENLLALPTAKDREAVPDVVAELDNDRPSSVASRAPSVLSRVSARTRADSTTERTHRRTDSAGSQASTHARALASESASAAQPRTRSVSGSSAASRRPSSDAATLPQRRRVSGSSISSRLTTRTPSPGGPETPIPAHKAKAAAQARTARSLASAELGAWGSKATEGAASADSEDGGPARADSDSDGDDGSTEASARLPRAELAMQVSPQRSFAGPSPGFARTSRSGPSWTERAAVPSPFRNPTGTGPGSPQARAAQDMLQALLRDALHDFRQETRGELVGLHLDLIRMGAGWRREMGDGLGAIQEELRELREENRRLREENERLRRGY